MRLFLQSTVSVIGNADCDIVAHALIDRNMFVRLRW